MANRRICTAERPRLQPDLEPARAARHLRHRRLAARPARGRRGGDRPGPDAAADPAAPRRRRPLPRDAASSARSTAGCRSRRSAPASSRRSTSRPARPAAAGPPDGHPQVEARDREDARRRPDRRRGPRPRRDRAEARRHDRPPRPPRRAPHPVAGAVPSFKGYGHRSNPFPASLCISIDDEVVHGIPGDRTIRDGQIVSVDAGRDLRRLARRRGPDVLRRRAAGRRSASSSTRPAWR